MALVPATREDSAFEPLTLTAMATGGEPRLRRRALGELRLHAAYDALVRQLPTSPDDSSEASAASEPPIVITASGTIIEGHDRWRRAVGLCQDTVLCLEHDVTDDVALAMILRSQQRHARLSAFCRVELALRLEPACQAERASRRAAHPGLSSKLTTPQGIDARPALARLAGVSTGNVTKVKQILQSAGPDLLAAARQGTVSIHRAWQWRTLSHARQREALWNREHRMSTDRLIQHLLTRQSQPQPVAEPCASERESHLVLEGLRAGVTIPCAIVVAEMPGVALVVTRALRDHLVSRPPSS